MGLGIAAVKLNLELWQRSFFKNIKSVDIGSQELHLKQADFEELIRVAGVTTYKKENFTPLANWPGQPRCSSKPFYEMLGVENYACIDLGREHGAIPLDLNLPLEDSSLYGQYDLVTDHGCNEHAFNIAEAYRTMHRLCKLQGLMIIVQSVWRGNGYYLFDKSFFEGIAAANNYKILFSSYIVTTNTPTSAGSENEFHIPLSHELLDVIDWAKVLFIGICYVLQKQADSDFKYPYQGEYLSRIQGHHGYEIQFLPNPPSRTYVPLRESVLEVTQVKVLINEVIRKIIRRIKSYFVKR